MPKHARLRIYIILAIVSWSLLLAAIYFRIGDAAATGMPVHATNVLAVVFILAIFLYHKAIYDQLKSPEFINLVWTLFIQAGITAYICLVLHTGYLIAVTFWIPDSPYLRNTIFHINFGLFCYFLAKAFYTWKQLILFQKTKALQIKWNWFEALVYASLALTLLNMHCRDAQGNFDTIVMVTCGVLGLYSLYMSFNLRWVAYLSVTKKWRAIFLLGAMLISIFIFVRYFHSQENEAGLVSAHVQTGFLLVVVFFVFAYALGSVLVALFSLPTSAVFEQKREDLLRLQRLSQSIQQGQNEPQVLDMLFDSARNATLSDAGWLEVVQPTGEAVPYKHRIDDTAINKIRQALKNQNIYHIDYINNNLLLNTNFRELGFPFQSMLVVTLKSKHEIIGVLYLLKEIEYGFDRENVNIVRTFTSQTILTIDNLRLVESSMQNERYKEELKIASLVQESLIPKSFPSDSWFEISTYAQAAKEVGGDFYDFLQLSESRIAIVIGDVSGKGVSAAFHMAQMKGIFHALMQDNLDPVMFMLKANSALSRCLERTSFITSSLYIIDYKMQGLAFARAGHCHTLYYNSMTEETFYFQTEGLGLGIIRDASYTKRIHKLHYDYNPGDVMVIYTDGVTEARNEQDEEYGEDRLLEMLKETYHLEADDIKAAMIYDLKNFIGNAHVHDDQTLLVVKFKNIQPKI